MATIRIQGLVKLANQVRMELARPIRADRLEQLTALVRRSVQSVRDILQRTHKRPESLAAPSRKAFEFLNTLRLDAIRPQAPADPAAPTLRAGPPPASISFTGLRSTLRAILAGLAATPDAARLEQIQTTIRRLSERIERQIKDEGLLPHQLTEHTRAVRGWLAYFADAGHLRQYLGAAAAAGEVFSAAAGAAARVHFLPTRSLYRMRRGPEGVHVELPTPMIRLDRDALAAVAANALGRSRGRQAITAAMLAPPYQQVQTELELLGGVIDRAAGVYHDLAAAFERVRAAYFPGMTRPRLTWSETFTSSKFGHYEHTADLVMVSSTLDSPDVAGYVVDFIVYHELLHRRLGIDWRNGRQSVHTPQFHAAEKRFARYEEASAALKKLAARRG